MNVQLTKEERDKAIDQIRKIKRKADGTSHEAEAEAFLKKVADMLNKHGLTEADLIEKDIEKLFGSSIYDLKYSDQWRRSLMNMAGKFCGVYSVYLRGSSKMQLYGRDLNVETAIETYIWIHDQIKAVARSLYPGDVKNYRQAQSGLSLGVCTKIDEIMKNYKPEGLIDTSVPMIVEYDTVRSFARGEDPTIKSSKPRSKIVTAAMVNGYQNAERINLRPIVEKGNTVRTGRVAIAK
jgi:hypothetical protein